MKPYLFVGDLHGNMAAADLAIAEAVHGRDGLWRLWRRGDD